MSPSDNKHVIRALVDAVWVGRDLDALGRFWAADCVNHAAPRGHDVGLAALRAYHEAFAAQFAAFADLSIEIVQQVAESDRVVTHLVARGRHVRAFGEIPATGREVSLTTIRIDRLVAGRIAEHWSVADVAGLLRQLHA